VIATQTGKYYKPHYPPSENDQHSYPEHRIQQQGKHDEFHAQEQQPHYLGRNPLRSQPMNRSRLTMRSTTPKATQPSIGAFGCVDCR
jgi:hypothetical protein